MIIQRGSLFKLNGVIVVTTKRPTEGRLRIKFEAGINLEIPDLTSYNLMDAREKLQLEWAAGLYETDKGPVKQQELLNQYYSKLADVERGTNTYWLSQPLQTGVGQRYNMRLEWGAEEFQVGASVAYNNVSGAMKGSERNNFSGNITLQYDHKNLTFRNQTKITINNSDQGPHASIKLNPDDKTSYGGFSSYAKMNPYWRIYDDEGNYIPRYKKILSDEYISNPLYDASKNIINKSAYKNITNNLQIEWRIIDGLTLRGTLGISTQSNTSDLFIPPSHSAFLSDTYAKPENVFRKGKYTYGTGESNNIMGNITLNYSKTFNEKHNLTAGIDFSMENAKSHEYTFVAEGFVNDDLGFLPSGLQYQQEGKPSGSESHTRAVGFTANAVYTYDNRYFADLSYRIDGSSVFGRDNQFAPFWSAGIGWNVHNEKFLKDSQFLIRMRLRASTGETGSREFSAYQALSTFSYYMDERYITWNGAGLMGLGNDKLKWQTTMQTNVGLEFGIFGGRLTGTVDYYLKNTSDLLSSMDLPRANGFTSYIANVGSVRNTGFEASLTGYLIRNTQKELFWSVTGKIAHNKNEITKLSEAIKAQTAIAIANNNYASLLFEGHSLNSIYAVPSLGIDPSTGREIFLDKDGNFTSTWNANARQLFGVSDPKYRGNISTYIAWRNLSLNLSFAYHWGGQQYNSTLLNKVEVTTTAMENNVDNRVYTDRWLQPGDVRFFKSFDSSATRMSSRFVMDDNVFQLQSVNLKYAWKSDYIRSLGIETLNFSLNMSDIFYLSSIKRERGTEYPFSRTMSLTISLLF